MITVISNKKPEVWKKRSVVSIRIGFVITEEERRLLSAFVLGGPFTIYIVSALGGDRIVYEPIEEKKEEKEAA